MSINTLLVFLVTYELSKLFQKPVDRFRLKRLHLTFRIYAGVAQLVERNLAKVEVASSNLVARSISWSQ